MITYVRSSADRLPASIRQYDDRIEYAFRSGARFAQLRPGWSIPSSPFTLVRAETLAELAAILATATHERTH